MLLFKNVNGLLIMYPGFPDFCIPELTFIVVVTKMIGFNAKSIVFVTPEYVILLIMYSEPYEDKSMLIVTSVIKFEQIVPLTVAVGIVKLVPSYFVQSPFKQKFIVPTALILRQFCLFKNKEQVYTPLVVKLTIPAPHCPPFIDR
jgi:hypothetical protein